MTGHTTPTDALVEKLRRKVIYRPNEWQLRNPDGPEAADKLEALAAEVERWKETATTAVAEAGHWCCTAKRHEAEGVASADALEAERTAAEAREAALIADNQRKADALEDARRCLIRGFDELALDTIETALLPSDTGAKSHD